MTLNMSVLLGDVTGNSIVNSSDIAKVKAHSGEPVSDANFRNDVTVSGTINTTDISQLRLDSGHGVP